MELDRQMERWREERNTEKEGKERTNKKREINIYLDGLEIYVLHQIDT